MLVILFQFVGCNFIIVFNKDENYSLVTHTFLIHNEIKLLVLVSIYFPYFKHLQIFFSQLLTLKIIGLTGL